jgi:class 3 adenylate cyclase
MMSLYAHPVVVNDENETSSRFKNESDYERHIAEAELRNVYTCFISPLIDYRLTGDDEKDTKLFNLLNDILNLARQHLDRACGHLRQFIVDDKGVVLIFTFGLRGSTFPNMIAHHAIPVTLSICEALLNELGVKTTAGATFGKAYCGVVGGSNRHEFAVLGPSVNLAARLMSPKTNSGVILVDKNVRLLTSQIFFKPLPAVKAKGYTDPVPIFQPIMSGEN